RQAKQQRDDADRNLVLRLAETYHWALAPTQPDPTGPVTWEATKIEGQGGLAARTSRKLVAEGALYEQFAPALLRMQLSGPLARLWEPGHVSATALWDAFSRYCYLPRIASARVLYDAVAAGPASTDWARDAFATADAYDESTGRYAGLVTGGFGSTAPTTLVVRPDVATRQVEADRAADDARADDAAQDGSSGAATDEGDGATSTKQDGPSAGPATPAPVSFYGVAILDSERPTKSFGKIHEEVVQPLVALLGTEVEVTVEVRAKNPSGFPPTVVRTVTENARALRLEPYEFGES
ncbi:MAG: AAA+ family ATPase, partial [Gaiellales bacterium]